MSDSCNTNLDGCLYFATNSLSRYLNEMAEEAFKITGISPAYAYVMLVILEDPGLNQNKIAKLMNLKASTVTRFIDKLISKGYVKRVHEGRSANVYPTDEGKAFKGIIEQSLNILHHSYCDILGEEAAGKLTSHIQKINMTLDELK